MKARNSWKQKIDPSFDKVIKAYLFMLEDTQLIRNSGWFSIKDEYIEKWEKNGSKGWYREYEKNIDSISDMPKTIEKSFVRKKYDSKELLQIRRGFKKELFHNLEGLPEESQKYYRERFKPFYSEEPADKIPSDITKEKLTDLITEFYANYTFLNIHKTSIEALKEVEPSDKEVIQMLSFMLFSANNTISLLVFGRNLFELIKEAKNGNSESFFKALQIDRSIIESTWVIKMIRKAQMSGDESFFKKMAKAIAKQPFKHDKEFSRAIMILLLFWHFGLNKLTNTERIELLEDCGIRVQDNPETFRSYVNSLLRANRSNQPVFSSQK